MWVLKELEPENWVNNGGTDFAVQLKAPNVQDVIQKVSRQVRLLSWDIISCSGGTTSMCLRGLVGCCITGLSTQMPLFAECKHSLIEVGC